MANPKFWLAPADTAPLELTWLVIVARATGAVLATDGRPLEHAARTSSTSRALTDIDHCRPRIYPLSRPLMMIHQPMNITSPVAPGMPRMIKIPRERHFGGQPIGKQS